MAITNGPNLGLAENGNQGEQHYSDVVRQWRGLDGLIQCHVKDKDLLTPPGVINGDCYIVPSGASGSWSGQTGKIARASTITNSYEFFTPKKGWRAHVEDENSDYLYNGTAWIKVLDNSALVAATTQTTVGAAGAAAALPAQPSVYILVTTTGGQQYVIPGYAVS